MLKFVSIILLFLFFLQNIHAQQIVSRVRPTDPAWPKQEEWDKFRNQVNHRLFAVEDPLKKIKATTENSAERKKELENLNNPFYIQDQMGGTQSVGWVNGWYNKLSVYGVEAETVQDVVQTINFARDKNLRLVVKGGAHSYLGQSNAPDSLLLWTKKLNKIEMVDDFVPEGGAGQVKPVHAVNVGAGAVWIDVYDKVVVKGKRYVQGGGCTSVGVGGHLQTGGFGSFSKGFGLSAAGVLEFEIVTSDGVVRIANAFTNPDLFWALKGAGNAFGIITRVTLRTPELPKYLGFISTSISAKSNTDMKDLIEQFLEFYRDNLMNPHWGESISINDKNHLAINLSVQGLTQKKTTEIIQKFMEKIAAQSDKFKIDSPLRVGIVPAHNWWDYNYRKEHMSRSIFEDKRPDGVKGHYWWPSGAQEVGLYLSGYESGWLHKDLLLKPQIRNLTEALYQASREHEVQLHFNKGMAGAPRKIAAEVRNMSINPIVEHAFTLVIIAGGQQNVFKSVPGMTPNEVAANTEATQIQKAMDYIRRIAPDAGGYSSEMNYFDKEWRKSAWGNNYTRLLEVKKKYDAAELMVGHHYVGSEYWSEDGFTRL